MLTLKSARDVISFINDHNSTSSEVLYIRYTDNADFEMQNEFTSSCYMDREKDSGEDDGSREDGISVWWLSITHGGDEATESDIIKNVNRYAPLEVCDEKYCSPAYIVTGKNALYATGVDGEPLIQPGTLKFVARIAHEALCEFIEMRTIRTGDNNAKSRTL